MTSKALGFLLLICCVPYVVSADDYLVYFNSKCGGSLPISSQALNKRALRGIDADERDLPVCDQYLSALGSVGVEVKMALRWSNSALIEATHEEIQQIERMYFVKKAVSITQISNVKKAGNVKLAIEEEAITMSADSGQYGSSYNQISMLQLDKLHRLGLNGRGVNIGIFDSGFEGVESRVAFQHLFDENRVKGIYNIPNNDANVYAHHDHGFYVLGAMAGKLIGEQIGAATGADYYLFRTEVVDFELQIEELNWARAAEMADSLGLDIINSSLGYTRFDDSTTDYTQSQLNGLTAIVTQAANIATQKGILVVNSAGNSRANSWGALGMPADGFDVVAAGAVDANKNATWFSSPGPSADGRVKPELCAMGQAVVVPSRNQGVARVNGTSFSAPLLSGAFACLWQAAPHLSAAALRELVYENAPNYTQPDNDCGYGIPNFYAAMQQVVGVSSYQSVTPKVFVMVTENSLKLFKQDAATATVSLTNVNGQLIEEKKISQWPYYWDTSNMVSGVYMLTVRLPQSVETKKLVIP